MLWKSGHFELSLSLSKTTKLILLDSLLQEVCISSDLDWSLTLSSLGLSVCLSQSQTSFFRAKESLIKSEIPPNDRRTEISCSKKSGACCTTLDSNMLIFFAALHQGVRVSLFPFCEVVIGGPSLTVYRDQAINAWFTSLRGVCRNWDSFRYRKILKFFYWPMKAAKSRN